MTKPDALTIKRFRHIRGDCRLDNLRKRIANEYGIPLESIRLVNPGGRAARGDKQLARLRQDHKGVSR